MSFRFGIFASVSTEEQAKDKDSLSNQVRDCRDYAVRVGGMESVPPFIADGYSRSFYEGLSEAMSEIPPLRDAVKAADSNLYDVLFVRYFDRLGVVAHSTFIRLGKNKKQLRSLQEITPIFPPEIYDVAKDDATSTMIAIGSIKQDSRINRIINNYRENMPRRVRDGLPTGRMPRGYKHINSKTPPELIVDDVAKIIRARDMLMEGKSYTVIGEYIGVDRSRVPTVLANPFYYGLIVYNKTYILRQGLKRVQVELPKSKWITGNGKHTPIFTEREHEAIVSEIRRRDEVKQRNNKDFTFSGLLLCGVCGARLRRKWHGDKKKGRWVIVCRTGNAGHVAIELEDFWNSTTAAIRDEMERERTGATLAEHEDRSELIRQQISERNRKRTAVQEGFEAGLYTTPEASARLRALESEIEALQKDLERLAEERTNRHHVSSLLEVVPLTDVPEWIRDNEPQKMNRLLSAWIRSITIQQGGTVQIEKR